MPHQLVPSLLQAIVVVDGEALVMHVGARPYVVCETGQIELSNQAVTKATVDEIINAVLSDEARRTLESAGAARCVVAPDPRLAGERFSVVAARGPNDSWLEIHRDTAVPRPVSRRSSDSVATDPRAVSSMPPVPPSPSVESRPAAAVVPLSRPAMSADPPPAVSTPAQAGLERLIRLAAARGASALYLVSGARPSVRVDGNIEPLDSASVLSPVEIEALLLGMSAERSPESLRREAEKEWQIQVDGLGPVRCCAFVDHRGAGAVLRLMPVRVTTVDQLGLPRAFLSVAESDGLILVAAPRGGGRKTLLAALVDHLAQTHRGHIVTIERDVIVSHRSRTAIVSQREVRGRDDAESVLRGVLREDPDVIVVDDIRSEILMDLLLEAASPGRLVVGALPASTAESAIDTVLDLAAPVERRRIQLALSHTLRAVLAQVLVHRMGGGRVAARELLLNTPAVAGLLAEGKTSRIAAAIEGGRTQGMQPMHEALAALVQAGSVDLREACKWAMDKPALLDLLRQRGVDVSAIERLA